MIFPSLSRSIGLNERYITGDSVVRDQSCTVKVTMELSVHHPLLPEPFESDRALATIAASGRSDREIRIA